jgi:HSP20 family molecular chaperone IbpA
MATDSGTVKVKDSWKDKYSSATQRDTRNINPITEDRQVGNPSSSTRNSVVPSQSNNSVPVLVNPEESHLHSKLNSKIASRAYELYEQNGANHGNDLFNWLQAETEILTRIPEIRQTDSSFSVFAPLESFSAEEISVTVEPGRALILADKHHSSDANAREGSQSSRESAFFITEWPGQVEPSTATAQLKQGNLVLTVKRVNSTPHSSRAEQ